MQRILFSLCLVYIFSRFLGELDAVCLGNNSSLKAAGPDQSHGSAKVQLVFAQSSVCSPERPPMLVMGVPM